MPHTYRRCGCNICGFNNEPIMNSLVILSHVSKYGEPMCDASPLSSPLKKRQLYDDDIDDHAEYFFTLTSESEHEVEPNENKW